MPTIAREKHAPSSPAAAKLARQSGAEFERLARFGKAQGGDVTVRINIEAPGGERTAITLPETARSGLAGACC